MSEVNFVDTTLRDGQMSLWATEMRTGMILPVASHMDQAGFEAIEIIAAAFFKKCVRELRENPWERLRLAADGVLQIRISDPSNTASHWREAVCSARSVGLEPIVNLIFSVSPKHTDEYY